MGIFFLFCTIFKCYSTYSYYKILAIFHILEPILYPIVYTSYSSTPMLPLPFPLVTTNCSLYLWVCLFYVIFTSLLYFLDPTCKQCHRIFIFLSLTYEMGNVYKYCLPHEFVFRIRKNIYKYICINSLDRQVDKQMIDIGWNNSIYISIICIQCIYM